MVKKIIEYDICDITQETTESLDIMSLAMHCLEENFYTMEFTVQEYKGNMLQSEYVFKPLNSILKSIVVDLDTASDEFMLQLDRPITVQTFDGVASQRDYINVEVVTEGIAEDNDRDFLRGEYNELVDKGEYKLGEVNSYYNALGTLDGINFYYREL